MPDSNVSWRGKRVFLTGHTGFIQELLQQESDLYILSQFRELTTKFVERFRQCAAPQGRSNLGLQFQ